MSDNKTTTKTGFFVAQEDTDVYNVFNFADFDEEGFLEGYNGIEGYHIDDFDIVYKSKHFKDCERYIELNCM